VKLKHVANARVLSRLKCAGMAVAGAVLLTAPTTFAEDESVDTNIIEFVTIVRSGQGVVRCGLFDKEGWLQKTIQPAVAKISRGTAVCVFRDIKPGTYGISAFHDANNNGKIDFNFLGMPVEDYCASRNARGVFGPPSFEDAKFKYPGKVLRLTVSMK
jgi:uncharacterized protein (DUF2141 family)